MFNSRCNIFLVNAHVRQCLAFEKLEMENIKLEIQKHLFICGYVFKDSFNRSKLRRFYNPRNFRRVVYVFCICKRQIATLINTKRKRIANYNN